MNVSQKWLLKIILLFFGLYFILTVFYNFFLSLHTPDFFTLITAKQVNLLYHQTGFDTLYQVLDNPAEIGIRLGEHWLVKIVEGCNGISVMIVFLSFIWAFPAGITDKIKFSILGLSAIWIVNLIRIYVLGLIYLYRPGWFDISHRVFFPASVYGMVIFLWVLWIRMLVRSRVQT
jgi:exosortase family protein XrtF